jgi:hypothetical protein
MKLYNLGKVPWLDSQLIYHALAEMGREALSLVSPATPYVCIGFHQDAEQEVDLDYCKARGISFCKKTTRISRKAKRASTENSFSLSSRCIAESASRRNTSP